MSQTLKPMTYDEFLDQFEGFEQDENGLPVEIDFTDHQAIIAAQEAQCLWTEFDDGHLENRSGFVNRCRYLSTTQPYQDTALIVVDAPQ